MPQSIGAIGKGAIAGALILPVLGAILEASLATHFPLALLPLIIAIGAVTGGYVGARAPPRRTWATPVSPPAPKSTR